MTELNLLVRNNPKVIVTDTGMLRQITEIFMKIKRLPSLFVYLYRLQAVKPCESKLQSCPQDQTDGATLLPLLEPATGHALESASVWLQIHFHAKGRDQ